MWSDLYAKGREACNYVQEKIHSITEKISSYAGPKFEVHINEGEYRQIRDWVLRFPDTETGGDLFGLWIDQHKCVVQLVLGPGKSCRRTDKSFYQDTSYLQNIGGFLSEKHGLCNIGQWHSHHRLNLTQPSYGDKRTVWNNLPVTGLNAYVVFIATIEGTHERPSVEVNCFLFELDADTGSRLPVVQGEFKFIEGNSPLRLHHEVYQQICQDAESINKITITHSELSSLKAQNISVYEDKNETGREIGRPADKGKANDFDSQGFWMELKEMENPVKEKQQPLNGEQNLKTANMQKKSTPEILHASDDRERFTTSENEVNGSRKNNGKETLLMISQQISGRDEGGSLRNEQNSSNSEGKGTVNGADAEEIKMIKDKQDETDEDNDTTYDSTRDTIYVDERRNSSVIGGYSGKDGCLAELQQRDEINSGEMGENHATISANVQEGLDESENKANQDGKDNLLTSSKEQVLGKTDDMYATDNNDKETQCKKIYQDPERENESEEAKKPNCNNGKENSYTEVNSNGREMSFDNRGGMENGRSNHEEGNDSTKQINKSVISSKHEDDDRSLADGGKTVESSDDLKDHNDTNDGETENCDTHL